MHPKEKAAAKALIVPILFRTNRVFAIHDLSRNLRELFEEYGDGAIRRASKISPDVLTGLLLEIDGELRPFGLCLALREGTVRLTTAPTEITPLREFLAQGSENEENQSSLSQSSLELLSAIAFKQPISTPELEQIFDTDKRSQIDRLERMGLIEQARGKELQGPRKFWRTTYLFLQRFKLQSIEELKAHV